MVFYVMHILYFLFQSVCFFITDVTISTPRYELKYRFVPQKMKRKQYLKRLWYVLLKRFWYYCVYQAIYFS